MKIQLKNFLAESRHLFVTILFLFNNLAFAQSNSIFVSGRILNAENSEPITNAAIEIVDQKVFATSKNDGTFRIGPIQSNNFRIKITHVAFQEKLIDIKSPKEDETKLVVYLLPKTINLSPVIVLDRKSTELIDELQQYNTKLSGKELHQKLGQTIASTLKNETGLAVRSMGPAPSRPVFRGLGQDRVLITEDGMKSIDLSATSPDHAVTVEPFTSERIEVLRGPKVLSQTSTTIGGIVNIIKEEIPEQIHNQPHFLLGSYFESVNKGLLGAIKSEVPLKPFQIKFEAAQRTTSELSTPLGILKNSASKNFSGSAGISYIEDFGFVGSGFKVYNLNYGIPGGFIGAHPFGVNIDIKKRELAFKSKINLNGLNDEVSIDFRNDYYRHKEFEHSGLIGSEFRIITNSGRIVFSHLNGDVLKELETGFSFELRDFDIGGYVFTPPTKSYNLSSFIYSDFHLGRFNIDAALRISYDVVDPKIKKVSKKIGEIKKREFYNVAASISFIYKLSDIVFIGSNFSRSTRVPTIEELFSEGPHLAAYSYEVGNPYLNSERGWGFEFFVYHKFEKLNFNLNAFYNYLNSYIIPRNTGLINYQTFLPIYATSGVNAAIYGVEGSVKLNLVDRIFLQSSFSQTIGEFRDTRKPLPKIPPVKGLNQISYETEKLTAGISNEWALSQNKVDEFEEPTAGYFVTNLFVQKIYQINKMVLNLSVNLENIFNQEYRNHLSRIKSIYPEPGRNLRIILKMYL
ncbi:MAG: TonB-dependent receptor [Ignavibacteria bacterium]|jgi:iron complex outermembrane receptor protein|nr:TonB-dependent receptor [Ignavibacteria bacterium]MDH7527369.1 TonB-dependent receptor [Ignavibacteria bacterium]